MRRPGHEAQTGEVINAYNILVGKYNGGRLLERPKHRPRNEDNIKTDLKGKGYGCVSWICLVQHRVQRWTCSSGSFMTVMNLWVS
jgi:hypothetical protein